MECPVCYESNPLRKFNGCRHKVCTTCYPRLAKEVEPFGPYVWLPVEFKKAVCPECRQDEPSPITPNIFDSLCKNFPLGYRIWFETTLFSGEDGTFYYTSWRKGNARVFPASTHPWNIFSILDRINKDQRTRTCMFDDKDLWNDPFYVYEWPPMPPAKTYPYMPHTPQVSTNYATPPLHSLR